MGRSTRSFLVWGSGGHGRVVADLVRATGHRVLSYVDSDPAKLGQKVEPSGETVSHLQDELIRAIQEDGCYPPGVDASALGLGDNQLRLRCLRSLAGLVAPPLVHPSATVSPTARLGRGSVIFPQAVVNAGARIDEAVIVNSGAIIEHDCVLHSGVHVSPGATLCGGVRVGEGSWIGAGATVIQDLTIGRDAIVGAGSTVIRDVSDDLTVVGRPARAIHS
ncbi:MAG: acetyltransferase [Gemmatimonadota bacterium]